MQALEIINAAITSDNAVDEASHLVDALRCIEAGNEDTRRMAIQRIDDHVKLGKASRGLVNLLIALRRVT